MKQPKVLKINDVEYIRADSVKTKAEPVDGMDYVIIRTYSAGVHAGYLKNRDGKEVTLIKARRLWYWSGAATLSQLAMEGVKKVSGCKFPQEVDEIILTEAIEVITCTQQAKDSISEVPVWKE